MSKNGILYAACAGLLLLSGALGVSYLKERKDNAELRTTIDNLAEDERKSEVVKRISKQMEDIAYQQKDISDKEREKAEQQTLEAQQQRIKAEQQTQVANEMRSQAELERRNAVAAEGQARASADQAKESARQANEQRNIADQQRRTAEYAKRTTDTLSYVALARSLGSLSSQRYTAGQKDLAALLAYGSWYYSDRYGSDPYYPAIFNALALSSNNKKTWDFNKGGITKLLKTSSGFVTVSNYGEIMVWNRQGNDLTHNTIFADKNYDFRDALLDGNNLYALSRDGAVVRINIGKPAQRFVSRFARDGIYEELYPHGNELLTFNGNQFTVLNKSDLAVNRNIKAPEKITHLTTYKGKTTFFTNAGKVYFLENGDKIRHELTMGVKDICSFASTSRGDMIAFGTKSGMVYLMDYPKMKNIQKLRGHQSMVTQVDFVKGYLVTASYDRTLKLWDTGANKLEPVTLNTFDAWLRCFYATNDNYIWTGDASGTLTRVNISPSSMARSIQKDLKRDLTQQEWNYYIGQNRPYEKFRDK